MKAENIVNILNDKIKAYRTDNNISSNSFLVLQRSIEPSASFMKALKTYQCLVWYINLEENIKEIVFRCNYSTSSLDTESAWDNADIGITEVIIKNLNSPIFEQIEKGEYGKHSDE